MIPTTEPLDAEVALVRQSIEKKDLERAAELCAALAAKSPGSPQASALMGEVEYGRGNAASAETWLEKALAADRKHARANWLLGNVCQDQGRIDRAISSFRRALRASPQFAEAHNDLGTAYQAKGWYAEAEQCYRQALLLKPEHQVSQENLATALRAQGKLREARQAFVAVLRSRVRGWLRRLLRRPAEATSPSSPIAGQESEASVAAGAQTQHESGDRAGAARSYDKAIARFPASPALHVARGLIHHEEREYLKALECFSVALALDPDHAAALSNMGMVLQDLGHLEEAEETYRLSIESDPDMMASRANRSAVLLALGKIEEAEAAASEALAISPHSAQAILRMGQVRKEQGRADEAEALLRRALELKPGSPLALHMLGDLYHQARGDSAQAQLLLEQSLAAAPRNPGTHITYAQVLLYRQRFAEGWEQYEWRRQQAMRARVYTKFPYPDWDGGSLDGKAVLINGEQGLGDEIMFASCFAELRRRAVRCVICCDHRLEKLFRRSFDGFEVQGGSHVSADHPFPRVQGIDVQVAAGSLPRRFRRNADEFPAHAGYLRPDPARVSDWKSRLTGLGPGLAVGLSWKGGTPLTGRSRRTLTLRELEPLLRTPGINWISLQFGDCAAELDAFIRDTGIRIRHWQDALDDVDETAALMCALDARISVCNTQVHLAGALGKDIWVLAPRVPDWRYGQDGDRMLWYPCVRLLRQSAAGDWAIPIAEARHQLQIRLQAG